MKNKKIIVYILTLAICLTSFSGCNSSSEKTSTVVHTTVNTTTKTTSNELTTKVTTNTDETSLEAETENKTEVATENETENETKESVSVIQTDDSAVVSQNADGSFNVLFVDTMCTMTFPASWAGRVLIEDDVVYSKKCSDYIAERNSGKLFTIMDSSDEQMNIVIPSSYLLGTFDDEYVIAFLPTDCDYDPTIAELNEEFSFLHNDLESVIFTAKCDSSPEFYPIDMSIYDSPNMYSNSVSGMWEDGETMYSNIQFSPYIGFRPKDGLFVYAYGLNGADTENEIGSYITNINSENYQWNTENWGEAGLIFMDGCIYSFTYYLSAPCTMSIEKLAGNSEYDISAKSWVSSSDFQDFDVDYDD